MPIEHMADILDTKNSSTGVRRVVKSHKQTSNIVEDSKHDQFSLFDNFFGFLALFAYFIFLLIFLSDFWPAKYYDFSHIHNVSHTYMQDLFDLIYT